MARIHMNSTAEECIYELRTPLFSYLEAHHPTPRMRQPSKQLPSLLQL